LCVIVNVELDTDELGVSGDDLGEFFERVVLAVFVMVAREVGGNGLGEVQVLPPRAAIVAV
jgi:hypothetical protein